jgi:nucleoside-diphosphate-sugar epimerase
MKPSESGSFPSGPVLVLGATSLIGGYALTRLAAAGAAVTAVSRRPGPEQDGVRWVAADVKAPGLTEAVGRAETVLSLSPIWLLPGALPALQAAGMSRLVAFSSTSRFTKQDSPEESERAVARKLADAEHATERFCHEAGIAWTILRPTLIYAEGRDANVSRLARLIRKVGVLPLSGTGAGLRQPVHADDLAAGAIAAASSPAAENRAYDLPGGETLTYREMAERVFEGLGRRPRIVTVPPVLWRTGLMLAAPVLPGATAAMGDRMAQDLTFDGSAAALDFGWSPRLFRPNFGQASV